MIWVACAGAFTLTLFVALAVRDRIQLSEKSGVSQPSFLEAFRGEGIPESITTAVFEYYSNVAFGTHVSVSPDDTFESLRVGQDDLEDDLQRLLSKLGLEMPSSADLRNRPKELKTIRDVVIWLSMVHELQGGAGQSR